MKNNILLKNILSFVLIAFFFLVSAPEGHAQIDSGWSEPVNISNSGSAYNPILIMDNDGTFHVIWFDLFDGYQYSKSDDGVTWTESKNINYPFSPPKTSEPAYSIDELSQPRFLLGSSKEIHIFWRDNKNRLYHSRTLPERLDNPAIWNGPTIISDSILDFDAKIDTYGNVNLAFLKNSGTDIDPAGIYYQKSKGTGWSEKVRLYASQYYRSLQSENAHVRIATSSNETNDNVYVVWDDLAQKKILMSSSENSGDNWGEAYTLVTTDEKSGSEIPHGAEINIVGNNVLLMWQLGQETKRCVQGSRLSDDYGITWGETLVLFGDLGVCPEYAGFYNLYDEYSLSLFKIQGDLALVAWNGNQWSDIQIQNELSTLQNPVTLDQILFGCQQMAQQNGFLYVVGCDEGSSKDIWFTSRKMGPISNWFPPPSAWSKPFVITRVSNKITSISSTVDRENNIHAVWTPQSILEGVESNRAIYYSVWNKIEWSVPVPILNLNGEPGQLSLVGDNQGRLLLVWIDETNQNLMFTWANSSRANIPLEWSLPIVLPVPARLVSSPNISTDDAGNIVVAYSVPFNERRGVYVIRSDDLGKNWSGPYQIFDAEFASWNSISEPKVAIGGDGRLHSLFTRFSLFDEMRPSGLFYSQSKNGGVTWSDFTEISDRRTSWGTVITNGSQALHLLWQEDVGDTSTVYYRNSNDDGQTWSSPLRVFSSNEKLVMNTATMDIGGQLHLLQITSNEILGIQDRIRVGSLWEMQESADWTNELDVISLQTFRAGSTSDGYIYAIVFIEANDSNGIPDNRLISFGRFVDVTTSPQITDLTVLPTPLPLLVSSTDTPNLQPVSTESLLADINVIPSQGSKNIVGFIMITLVVIIMVVIIRPTRSNKKD